MLRESHYEDVARILGDTVTTIDTHCSELGFTPSFRKAWETAHARSKIQTTDGTAQPEWLDRFRKVRTPNHHKVGVHALQGTDSRLVADVPVSIIKPFVRRQCLSHGVKTPQVVLYRAWKSATLRRNRPMLLVNHTA